MANNFTYHEVSEQEKEEIKKNAKQLLDEFSSKLASIKTKASHFSSSESSSGLRKQGQPWKTEQMFQEITLSNAPYLEDNFIVAEKGGWKK